MLRIEVDIQQQQQKISKLVSKKSSIGLSHP